MSLPHALLTSLLEKSCSGYDLARRFDKSIGFFWQASHQQIYRELARMEAAGWIFSVADSNSRTKKRIYSVLPSGVDELKRWVDLPTEPIMQRDEFFVRLRADAAIGPLDLAEQLHKRMAVHQEKLDRYHAIERRDFLNRAALTRQHNIQHMILKAGILYEQHMLAWSQDMVQVLHEFDVVNV